MSELSKSDSDFSFSDPARRTEKAPSCSLSRKCKQCSGFGYIARPISAFAKAHVCDCVLNCGLCHGQSQQLIGSSVTRVCKTPTPRRVASLINEAFIPSRYTDASFEAFQATCINASTERNSSVLQKIKNWLADFSITRSQGFVLGGPVGVGKTYILASVCKKLAEMGVAVRFVDFFQLLSHIRAGYSENKAEAQILAPLIQVDVLVIDELGKGKTSVAADGRNTDFENLVLDQLVMSRYNEGKITLASTNCLVEDISVAQIMNNKKFDGSHSHDHYGILLNRVGERIYSRLVETCLFLEMDGVDLRRRKK